MKKDVSDHIARTFIESKKTKKKDSNLLFYIVVSLLVIVGFISMTSYLARAKSMGAMDPTQSIIFEKHDGPYVLSFNFKDASSKVATLTIDIPGVDLSLYKRISFSMRTQDTHPQQLGVVKVGLVNTRRESSSLYLSEVNNSWKKLSLSLSAFDKIQDWSRPLNISFTLEEWNIVPIRGKLLIDSIEFSKN